MVTMNQKLLRKEEVLPSLQNSNNYIEFLVIGGTVQDGSLKGLFGLVVFCFHFH